MNFKNCWQIYKGIIKKSQIRFGRKPRETNEQTETQRITTKMIVKNLLITHVSYTGQRFAEHTKTQSQNVNNLFKTLATRTKYTPPTIVINKIRIIKKRRHRVTRNERSRPDLTQVCLNSTVS